MGHRRHECPYLRLQREEAAEAPSKPRSKQTACDAALARQRREKALVRAKEEVKKLAARNTVRAEIEQAKKEKKELQRELKSLQGVNDAVKAERKKKRKTGDAPSGGAKLSPPPKQRRRAQGGQGAAAQSPRDSLQATHRPLLPCALCATHYLRT